MLARVSILIWFLLSPAALDALSKITEAEIISGQADLYAPMSGTIHATGRKDGQTWDIEVEWKNGYPRIVKFSNPQAGL